MNDLKAHIEAQLADAVNVASIENGELTIDARRAEIMTVISFLRDDPICKFSSLIDICGVDYPSRERRFDVVYHMLSMAHNTCLLYTSPSPRDRTRSRMPSSA